MRTKLSFYTFLTLLSGLICIGMTPAGLADSPSRIIESLQRGDANFESLDGQVTISSDFPGGRMSRCQQVGPDAFAIMIAPESDPINDSAWYAFQVQSEEPKPIRLLLHYVGGSHRYEPKISRDGENWETANGLISSTSNTLEDVELVIQADDEPLWIAGQELLSTDEISQWSSDLTQLPHVEKKRIGRSVQGRSVDQLTITECEEPSYVYIIARQHPPEVTGAIGMVHFVDAIAGQTEIARQFRKRFAALVVPTVNPDGVHHGHWRCNANDVDLNRDWSHFTQPETRAVRDQLLECRKSGDEKLCAFIDFHSTFDDVFYIPSHNPEVFPSGFTKRWFGALQDRFPNYEVSVDNNHNSHRSTSKAWVDRTLGVTAVTYEFGDETDRDTIEQVAGGAAEEMMRILLELPEPETKPAMSPEKFASPEGPKIRLVSGVEEEGELRR